MKILRNHNILKIFIGTLFFCQVIFGHVVLAKALEETSPLTIDVFISSSEMLVQKEQMWNLPKNSVVRVYPLDQLQRLNKMLNAVVQKKVQLEGRDAAINMAKKRVTQYKALYQQASMGMNKVNQFHITEIPAIVFNGRYCVLGTLDVDHAYEVYQDWIRSYK